MKKLLLMIAIATSLGACGQDPVAYDGVGELAEALAASGHSCDEFEVEEAAAPEATGHESLLDERGTCSIDGESITLLTFDKTEHRDDWLAVGRQLGPVAVGPNWVVTAGSQETIAEVAEALNASTDSRS